MSANNGPPPFPPGFENANEHRARVPAVDLVPYENQWVAWSADSTRILAHGAEWEDVERRLTELGIAADQVIFERITSLP
jgi:hypothetical protein